MDNNELTSTLKSILEKLSDITHQINMLDEKLAIIRDDMDKRFDGIDNEFDNNVFRIIDERADGIEECITHECEAIVKKLDDLEYNLPG